MPKAAAIELDPPVVHLVVKRTVKGKEKLLCPSCYIHPTLLRWWQLAETTERKGWGISYRGWRIWLGPVSWMGSWKNQSASRFHACSTNTEWWKRRISTDLKSNPGEENLGGKVSSCTSLTRCFLITFTASPRNQCSVQVIVLESLFLHQEWLCDTVNFFFSNHDFEYLERMVCE